MKPLVSVLLPTRNGSQTIQEAIASVLKQQNVSFELIVVDDGSSDGTGALVRGMADDRFKILHNATTQGLAHSLNTGIKCAQGTYIARIDDDDIWTDPAKLKQQAAYLDAHPDIGLIGTAGRIVDEHRRPLHILSFFTDDKELRRHMLQRNQFIHSSVMFPRALVRRLGGYDAAWRQSQDYELWLRIGRAAKLANLPALMVDVRQRREAVSHQWHRQQFSAFFQAAFRHRGAYPHFIRYMPGYAVEAILNMIPLLARRRLRAVRNALV